MLIEVFAAGETIISEGEDGDSAFLIVEGEVEVLVGKGEEVNSVAKFSKGDIFGEMSLLDPGPRSATVKALVETRCLSTSYDDFMSALQDNPEKCGQFTITLVRRLRNMNEVMVSMDQKNRSFRDLLGDWQKSVAQSENHELTDEEKQQNLLQVQAKLPFI